MSWIFGLSGNISPTTKQHITGIIPSPTNQYFADKLILFCGGINETLHFECMHETGSGWIVCGLGKQSESAIPAFMDRRGWGNRLLNDSLDLQAVNGHFTGVKWTKDRIVFFNDSLGLRDMYFLELPDCIAFSTHLSWLTGLGKKCRLNFRQFGAAWLHLNQWSAGSLVNPVERLGPGRILTIQNKKKTLQRSPWGIYPIHEFRSVSLTEQLTRFTLLPLNHRFKLSLGLSGGLDSRVLLAILRSCSNHDWSLHSFGDAHHPDSKIAQQIAKHYRLDFTVLNNPLPPPEQCITQLHRYLGEGSLFGSASEVLRLSWYQPLSKQKKVVIDGGFGEIARRQYLNRLLFRGRNDLIAQDFEKIANYLTHYRGNFFNPETKRMMQEGIPEQLKDVAGTLPSMDEIGIENWLDLFAIRSRLPNWYGSAQACVDGLAVNYMPFAQQDVLSAVFSTPLDLRKDGQLFRKIILRNEPGLRHFPLVKGSVTYPYASSTLKAIIWTMTKQKLGIFYHEQDSEQVTLHLHEFIRDTVHSQSVKTYEHYDYKYLLNLVQDHFSGKKNAAKEIDWWLAFDIWRKEVSHS